MDVQMTDDLSRYFARITVNKWQAGGGGGLAARACGRQLYV